MKRWFVFCFILIFGSTAFAQKTKTVTNADLEEFRQRRVQAERNLRENYARLGFPSPEELESRNERQRAEMSELAEELRRQQLEKQSDVLAQANLLRSQIASVEAQIQYLRGAVNSSSSGVAVVLGGGGYGGGYSPYRGGRPWSGYPYPIVSGRAVPQNMQSVQNMAMMYPNSQDVYNRAVGRYAHQQNRGFRGFYGFYGKRGYGKGYYRGGGGYAVPIIIGSGEPGYLASQLIQLEQQRAGLLAQWELLEEQARRAGIKLD